MNAASIGLAGIQRAEASASASASNLARASTSGADLPHAIVGLQDSSNGVAIGAKVVETGERLTKALLDIFA